jgi:HK97 family phage major capsid protein
MSENQVKGFNATLAEAIEKNADSIAKLGRGEAKRSGFVLDTKAVGNMTEAVNLTGDIPRQYAPQVYALPNRKVHIRSLLPVGTISTGLFTFPKETGGEGDVAPQTQGSSKAQIDFDITMTDAPAQYIAGFVRISRQMLDDVPAMTSFLQARLLEKYLLAEDAQLLNGSGTAPNLTGLTINAASPTGSATVDVEQLVQAIAQVSAGNYSANGILINPTDWANIMNTKPTNAAYSLPGSTVVTTDGSLTIAGIPVFQSTAIAADKFLVGDWSMGAQIMQNQGISVQFSEMDSDNFQKNLITVRVEARIAFPIYYNSAFVYGDFGNVA